MAENSKIEWTDHTFNPWTGCTKVSPGCDHCYAEGWAKRSGTVQWGDSPRRRTTDANWRLPLKWNAQAEREGRRFRVFCASLADVFDNQVPPEWRVDLFRLIEATPQLDWLLLTKRIGNARSMSQVAMGAIGCMHKPLPSNVWLGATVVNQEEADRDIPKLLATPARVRFLSMEPLLGPVDLITRYIRLPMGGGPLFGERPLVKKLHWVIVGGESGPGARPMHPDWARSLRDQCAAASVPFLFKQWGEWLPWSQFSDSDVDDPPEQTRFRTLEHVDGEWRDVGRPGYLDSLDGVIDDQQCIGRVGKKVAGRLLDGVTHDGFPGATS
jgi:protein gp37